MIEYPNMKPSELAETMGAEFLKLMEAHFPMLCQLERQVADPHSDSDNPAVAMLGDHGAAWGQLLPKGVQNGQCLVWAQGDGGGRWEAGEGGAGAYDGEFALYMDGTKLMVKEGHVCVNGMFNNLPCYVPNTEVVDTKNLVNNDFVHVYLCAYQGIVENGEDSPVREVRPGIPAQFVALVETSNSGQGVRGYIDLGTYQEGVGIKQNYLGGSGAQIVVGLPHCGPVNGGCDQMLLKWNAQTETWQADYLSPIA